ncbi:Hypothetical protein PBC10988_41520 [Planctomycetales bacterium 10988]|nr:Hypothetical protein PBC10988_41520 [Planctomycetales bacterium 10988]
MKTWMSWRIAGLLLLLVSCVSFAQEPPPAGDAAKPLRGPERVAGLAPNRSSRPASEAKKKALQEVMSLQRKLEFAQQMYFSTREHLHAVEESLAVGANSQEIWYELSQRRDREEAECLSLMDHYLTLLEDLTEAGPEQRSNWVLGMSSLSYHQAGFQEFDPIAWEQYQSALRRQYQRAGAWW